MSVEEHVSELIPGYALEILDSSEEQMVSEHLQACARCQDELRAYRQVMDDLPLAMAEVEPPTQIKEKIMQQALAMGLVGFAIGATLIRLAKDYFPRRVVLETSDTAILLGIIIMVCLIASVFGVRSALKIDPASALGG